MGIQRRGGWLHTEVIPDLKTKTIKPIVERQIQEGATISTDEMNSYNLLEVSNYNWSAVNHEKGMGARLAPHELFLGLPRASAWLLTR
jgi:transposase